MDNDETPETLLTVETAFHDYLITQKVVNEFDRRDYKGSDELKNIFERMMISSLQFQPDGSIYTETNEHLAIAKAQEEIRNCSRIRRYAPEELAATIRNACRLAKQKVNPSEIIIKDTDVRCKTYHRVVPKDVLAFLRSKSQDNVALLASLMQLDRTQCGGQQWSMPKAWYQHLTKKFGGVTIVCYGSPFNVARASMVDNGLRYFSINSIDRLFGSEGRFSVEKSLEIIAENKKEWSVVTMNPPFIETILADAARAAVDIVKNTAKGRKVIVFFNGPGWSDGEFTEIIDKSGVPGLVKRHLASATHCYENCFANYTTSRIRAFAPYGSFLWALSNVELDDNLDITTGYEYSQPKRQAGRGARRTNKK